jgi:hypothetical protein
MPSRLMPTMRTSLKLMREKTLGARKNWKADMDLASVVGQFVGDENEIATTRAVNALAVC